MDAQKINLHKFTFAKAIFWILFIALVIFLLLYRLEYFPVVSWDEGWTLDAARNWIEHGHLGHYLEGQPIPPRIPVRFPVVLPVALSMKLLGIGIWQGRLPEAIFTFFTLLLSAYLNSKLYGRRAGIITLFVLLFFSPFFFNPIIMGRQIIAEMPMMFLLLGGYVMLWLALVHSSRWSIGAMLLFGFAIHAKLQVPPFWLASISLAIWMSVSTRRQRSRNILITTAAGSVIVGGIVYWIQNMVMPGAFNNPELTRLLFNSVIFIFDGRIRLIAVIITLIYALPQFLSFIWAGQRIIPGLVFHHNNSAMSEANNEASKKIIQVSIWTLGVSWFLWYLALGLSWERYLYPPFFIGSLFFAIYLDEITKGLNLKLLLTQVRELLFHRAFNRRNVQSFVVLVVISISLGMVGTYFQGATGKVNADPFAVVNYLEKNLPAGARIETFESELLFLAPDLAFHYPSDLVSMQLNRRSSIDSQTHIAYDPMEAQPDYLVNGRMSTVWYLYDDVIEKGLFELEAEVGGYQVYRAKAVTK